MDSIIFDVDGTLWNSTKIVAKAWTDYLLQKEGMDLIITPEKLMTLFGRPLPDIAKSLFPDSAENERLRLINACCNAEHAALLQQCAPLYEGLEETLQILSRKYPLFIVSNCQAGYIEIFLKTTGFGHYFQDHVCHGDNNKDKGDNITLIIERHQLKSPIYVGDTMGDYEACQKSGVPFVFASYGFGSVPAPDAVIQKPLDLTRLHL